jgi:hypothetical protein
MNGQPPKKPRGCFFYGCISGLALLLVMVVALLLGVHYVKKMINTFTDDKPLPLPVVQLSPEQNKALHERLDAFDKALKEHRDTPPLALTGDEINAWIATSPSGQSLTGRVYVTIDGDQLKGQVSLPMSQLGLPFFRGRYLNGSVTFSLSFSNGVLHVIARDVTVKGQPLPNVYMQRIRQTDLAQNAMENPNTRSALERYEEIKIANGKLIVVPKKPENDSSQPSNQITPEAVTNR